MHGKLFIIFKTGLKISPMKKLLVLFIAFTFFGFSTPQSPEPTLKAIKIQPLSANTCNVALELHNDTSQKINYLSMYCSYDGFYQTDNPDVKIVPKPCDKNFPITKTLPRYNYHLINLELQMAKDIKESKFKIGFRYIDVPKGIDLVNFDTTQVKSIIVWSNTIEYKSR